MKKVAWVALLLLVLSVGAVQAQQAPDATPHASWFAALADFVEAIFGANQGPTPQPNATGLDNDCGAGIDPTGSCRG